MLSTISDKKMGVDSSSVVSHFVAEVLSQSDYYPFGMQMPQRSFSAGNNYRYGFNGKENDGEMSGWQDYGFREYDVRLGRFISVDPITKKYPELTPYQFASNRPIDGIDQDGLEWEKSEKYFLSPVGKYVVDYKVVMSLNNRLNTIHTKDASDKKFLDDVALKAGKILSNTATKGTLDDPISNVQISFTEDEGTFKAAFHPLVIESNKNSRTGDVITTTRTGVDVIPGSLPYNGITETIGETQNNKVGIVTSQTFFVSTDGRVVARSTNIKTREEMARTLAHELGHTLGLNHPWSVNADQGDLRNEQGLLPVGDPKKVLNNLMNSEGNIVPGLRSNQGTNLTPGQRKKIDRNLSNTSTNNE